MNENPTALPPPTAAVPPPAPAQILVVDDQPANIQLIGSILGKHGHEIIPASDGPTALRRVALRLPDLILLDLLMPGMDGCEVCRQLRANQAWNDVPVLFLSAADDKDFIVRALAAGAIDYITKPFSHAELISRVHTQLALKMTRDQLKQIAEDKDELVGILTHDLKNHLGGMEMSASLLRDRMTTLGDEKARLLCENIFLSTNQLLAFVKEFLANSAAEHHLVPNRALVDVCDAVRRTAERYHDAALRKQLVIHAFLPEEGAVVLTDGGMLSQILDNLTSNAVKFSAPDRLIELSVQAAGDLVECHIRDQGPGFTAEDRAKMFRRYSRLSARPTGGEPSTGLGLSIIKRLVHLLKGDLTWESSPGRGTTFVLRLWRSPREEP